MAKKKKKNGNGDGGAKGKDKGTGGFTDMKRVKELIDLMTENGVTEVELAEGGSKIVLRRGVPMAAGGTVHHVHAAPVSHAAPAASAAEAKKEDENLVMIKSPMVGTFYAAPNPDSDAYVSVGSDVEKDKTVVCVIEAMKVFNEIHADTTGSIVKVLVSNGQAVEFGQGLFLVRPA